MLDVAVRGRRADGDAGRRGGRPGRRRGRGSVDAALAEVEAALGPVDVWVNNAGIAAVAHAARIADRVAEQQDEAAPAR